MNLFFNFNVPQVTTSSTACRHPEHNPPQHISLQPGGYSWTCPGCGHHVAFTVSGAIL